MKGTSVRHYRSVYAEKRYNFNDIRIGYNFSDLTYISSNGKEAIIDMDLIHDIVPQCTDEKCVRSQKRQPHHGNPNFRRRASL
jgi:hypothetical protein